MLESKLIEVGAKRRQRNKNRVFGARTSNECGKELGRKRSSEHVTS
jgi:hypothetical protein